METGKTYFTGGYTKPAILPNIKFCLFDFILYEIEL